MEFIKSPFGFYATRAPKGLSDSEMTHVFRGQHNSPQGADCWLNAVLCLTLTIKSIRKNLLELPNCGVGFSELSLPLKKLMDCWMHQQRNAVEWRKDMRAAHDLVWQFFQAQGFSSGKNHCVVDAFLLILNEMGNLLNTISSNSKAKKDWLVSHLPSLSSQDLMAFWDSIPSSSVNKDKNSHDAVLPTKYVVLMNPSYGNLSSSSTGDYRLHSFISFEEIGQVASAPEKIASHFTCLAFNDDGQKYFIHDDLLRLRPGDWQGGVVDRKRSQYCFDMNISHFKERVPICIFKRVRGP